MLRTTIHKGIKVLIFYFCLWLVALFGFRFVQAESVSTHNEEQAAKQAALDRLYDAGCIRTHMRRTGSFSVIGKNIGQMDIIGYTVTIECIKWAGGGSKPPSSVEVYVFTWIPPETREDGTPLLPEEIAGYNVYVNSELIGTVTGTQWEYALSDQLLLPVGVAITTVDTSGQESSKTEEIRVSQ